MLKGKQFFFTHLALIIPVVSAPVYKYNVDSGIETKIMDAYSNVIDTSYSKFKISW